MKLAGLISALAFALCATQAQAVVLTFDDMPPQPCGGYYEYYRSTYGIEIDSSLRATNQVGSTWGPPHSGSNVLAPDPVATHDIAYMYAMWTGVITGVPQSAYSIGGYFSTQPGAIMELRGYHSGSQVAAATIGMLGASWNNQYAELYSIQGIDFVELVSLTTDSFHHFCVDDITVNFVP